MLQCWPWTVTQRRCATTSRQGHCLHLDVFLAENGRFFVEGEIIIFGIKDHSPKPDETGSPWFNLSHFVVSSGSHGRGGRRQFQAASASLGNSNPEGGVNLPVHG
jgi:hypothetical protein